MKDRRPVVAITMGDAAGIGPEITLKALEKPELYNICLPLVLGDLDVMEQIKELCRKKSVFRRVSGPDQAIGEYGTIDIIDYDNISPKDFNFGEINPICGKAAVRYTVEAGKMAMERIIGAMVSAPLNKSSMGKAGYDYEGQTQILGELTEATNYGMILVLDKIRIMMYSTHMSLSDAIRKVSIKGLLEKIRLAREGLAFFNIENPVIAVSAINPHCGEGGLFGRQEIDIMEPAIEKARAENIDVRGPVPADIIFSHARNGDYDLVIAMYHDQANMAVKLLGFGSVVTLLAGLPIIRTSTGHGTAFDIAGKCIADETNLVRAIRLAARLATNKGA